MRRVAALVAVALFLTLPVQAGLVQVEIRGAVEYNQVRAPVTFNRDVVFPGDSVVVSFRVDSDDFVDSSFFPTRGYVVIPDSYTIRFDAGTGPVIEPFPSPYPFGGTPFFVIRDNDPRVDGFFVSTDSVDYPYYYLWVDEPGRIETFFQQTFEVTYPEERLPSLDIYDAVGSYDFDGLSSYYFTMLDGFADAMGLLYTQMTISRVPVEVPVDFRPGGCPNPLNMRSAGVLPVAILGTGELDVTTLDPASIRLNGVPPLRSSLEDVGTPFYPFTGKTDCSWDCNEDGRDGYMDLTLKFDTQAVAAMLGMPADGACVVLQLTGNFKAEFDGGAPIVGEDVARIQRPGGGPPPRLVPRVDRLRRDLVPGPRPRTPAPELGPR